MEVTRENFAAVVDEFCELAETCDFFAIDEEMTGINLPDVIETPIMSIEERYAIKKVVAERYNIIQVGVCLFHKVVRGPNEQNTKPAYVARPFNFFLFPPSVEDVSGGSMATPLRSDVVLSSSAIAFLRRHGMDFQRWVYRGVPYCTERQEVFLRKQYAEFNELSSKAVVGNANDEAWVAESMVKAEAFSGAVQAAAELTLPPTKSRAARDALKISVEKKFPNLLVAIRGRGAHRDTILQRVTPEEKKHKADADMALRERALLDNIGFRRAFLALSKSGKPCAGHNSFADILFLLAALDQPLPENLVMFKERLHVVLPMLFDTKVISSDYRFFPPSRFDSTHLGGLHDAFSKNPLVDVRLPLGFQGYHEKTLIKLGNRGPAHEAGYDALMTGTVLLNLMEEAKLDMEGAKRAFGNKVALFRSLFLLDASVGKPSSTYLPKGPVVLVEHKKGTPTSELESCVNGLERGTRIAGGENTRLDGSTTTAASLSEEWGLTFMTMNETSTAIAPMVRCIPDQQMEQVQLHLNTKFNKAYKAVIWKPDDVQQVPKPEVEAAGNHLPVPQTLNPRALLRRLLMSAANSL